MKTWFTYNWLKLLALLMSLAAIYPFSTDYYFYYQFLSWVVLGAAFISVQQAHLEDKVALMWVLILTAVIFNPFQPFYLTRVMWQAMDLFAALVFFVSIITLNPKR